MNHKIYTLILASSFALFLGACSESSSSPDCEEDCMEEMSSSGEESSSSEDGEDLSKSSSSVADVSSSSENFQSSSSSALSSEEKSSSSLGLSSSKEESSSSSVVYLNTTPNLADLETSGDTLFAIFQRQSDDFSAMDKGLLALYNLKSGTLLDTICLQTKNPSAVKVSNGEVYVSTNGEYDQNYNLPADENRGIEKINLKEKTSALWVSGTKLGGGASDFIINKKTGKGYVAVYKSYGNTPLVEVDLSTKATKIIDGIQDASGSLEYDENENLIYVGDRFMDWTTFVMHIGVFSYDGKNLLAISDADPEEEVRMPYSIKSVQGKPYVFVTDFQSGKFYANYQDSESDGVSFWQDSKLATANGKLYLMERNSPSSLAEMDLTNGKPVWQTSLGNGNPYDLVAADEEALWVAFYDIAELRKVSAQNGKTIESISTAEFCMRK